MRMDIHPPRHQKLAVGVYLTARISRYLANVRYYAIGNSHIADKFR